MEKNWRCDHTMVARSLVANHPPNFAQQRPISKLVHGSLAIPDCWRSSNVAPVSYGVSCLLVVFRNLGCFKRLCVENASAKNNRGTLVLYIPIGVSLGSTRATEFWARSASVRHQHIGEQQQQQQQRRRRRRRRRRRQQQQQQLIARAAMLNSQDPSHIVVQLKFSKGRASINRSRTRRFVTQEAMGHGDRATYCLCRTEAPSRTEA